MCNLDLAKNGARPQNVTSNFMRTTFLFSILTFLTYSCGTKTYNRDNVSSEQIDQKNPVDTTRADSVVTQYIAIYGKSDKPIPKQGLFFQLLIDSIVQYDKIRKLIADSGAIVYFLNPLGKDNNITKTLHIDKHNARVDIRNFDHPYYYLALKYNFYSKSIFVLNNCKSKDSCSLGQWNKNCW